MTGLTKLDDQAIWAWENVRAFLDGVAAGSGALQTSMTKEQRDRWNVEWGSTFVIEQFLVGYDQAIKKAVTDWENTAESVWEFIKSPIDSTETFLTGVKQVITTVADPSKADDFRKAGNLVGEATAGWLNESLDSPPEFAKKCGELAALIVVQAIESVGTAGTKKLADLASIVSKMIDKLPDRMRRKKRKDDGGNEENDETRGIEDKGTRTKLDEVTPEVHKAVDDAFEKYTTDPKLLDSKVGDRSPNDWQHDKRKDKQDQNEPLPDEAETIRGGTRQDVASESNAKSIAFSRALGSIEKSFRHHSVEARKSLGPTFVTKLERMAGLREEMADLAKTVKKRSIEANGTVDLVIQDEKLLERIAKNYWDARNTAKAYGQIRDKTWHLMFNDPNLQRKLLNDAFPELKNRYLALGKRAKNEPEKISRQREKLAALLNEQSQNRRSLWDDVKTREDILWHAYGLVWKKSADGKKVRSPRSPVRLEDDKIVTDALELEHLLRQADNPYQALNPKLMTPTTKRINGTINEALRKIEREQTQGFYKHNPSDDDLISNLIQANKDAINALKPK